MGNTGKPVDIWSAVTWPSTSIHHFQKKPLAQNHSAKQGQNGIRSNAPLLQVQRLQMRHRNIKPETSKNIFFFFVNKNNYDNIISYMIWGSFNFHSFYSDIHSTSKFCHLFREVFRGQSMNYGNTLLPALSIHYSFYFLPRMYQHLICYMTGLCISLCVHGQGLHSPHRK